MPPSPILRIKNLTVRREISILQNINWDVNPGEHWVILGPNGSGKTSLLAALTAYLTPSSGTIEVLGQKYGETDWRKLRKHIGLVSSALSPMIQNDETAVNLVVSGKEAMINYWGKISEADRKKALKILKEVDGKQLQDRPWIYLSQGERQRLLIGRALMANYKILILDEPCAGLDMAAREHFLQFLEKLARKKKGPRLILVTHHVEEIMPAFTHVLLLKKGRVCASGEKKKVLNTRALSQAFETPIRLTKTGSRSTASIRPGPRII